MPLPSIAHSLIASVISPRAAAIHRRARHAGGALKVLQRAAVLAGLAGVSSASVADDTGWVSYGHPVFQYAQKHWIHWENPKTSLKLWYSPAWHDWWTKPINSGAPGGTMFYAHYVAYAARSNAPSGWTPLVSSVRVPENPRIGNWVLREGWARQVQFKLSTPIASPGASSVASCQTAQATVSETSSFSTTTAMGGTVTDAQGGLYQNTLGYSLSVQAGFNVGVASGQVSHTFDYAHTAGSTWDHQVSSNWTDTNGYTHSFTQSAALAPGIIGVPSVQAPMVLIHGVHWLQTTQSAPARPLDGGPGGFVLWGNSDFPFEHGGEGASLYFGWVSVPAKELIGAGPAAHPVWYVDTRAMTINQYRQYCKGDFQFRRYAPGMKAALCQAGIDTGLTCK